MFGTKKFIYCSLFLGLIYPFSSMGQSADLVKQLQKALIKMQLEMEEYQGELQDQFSEQRQLLEQAQSEIERLSRENKELQEKVFSLETEQAVSKQSLNELSASSSTAQFDELSLLVSSLMLAEFGDSSSLEEQLLEMLNEGSNLPADQLILMLAESHKDEAQWKRVSDFMGSRFLITPKAIFLTKPFLKPVNFWGNLIKAISKWLFWNPSLKAKGNMEKKPGKNWHPCPTDLVLHLFCCRFRIRNIVNFDGLKLL